VKLLAELRETVQCTNNVWLFLMLVFKYIRLREYSLNTRHTGRRGLSQVPCIASKSHVKPFLHEFRVDFLECSFSDMSDYANLF
jgi:hypothetical protein